MDRAELEAKIDIMVKEMHNNIRITTLEGCVPVLHRYASLIVRQTETIALQRYIIDKLTERKN